MKKSLIRKICLAIMLTTAAVENTFGRDGVADQPLMTPQQLLNDTFSDVFYKKPLMTPQQQLLFDAIEIGDYDGVRASLDQGADIKAKNRCGEPPLYYAACISRYPMARESFEFIVDLLIDQVIRQDGAINQENILGETALYPLVQNTNFTDVVSKISLLVENGADINHRDYTGVTPLCAALFCSGDHVHVIQWLLEHGALINSQDKYGDTPLWMAVSMEEPARVSFLLDHGADSRIRNNRGKKAGDNPTSNEVRALLIHHERMRDRAIGLFLDSDELNRLSKKLWLDSNPESEAEFIPNTLYGVGPDVARLVIELL